MPRRSTVIIVNDFMFVNAGTAQVAISSACELSSRGWDVIFFGSVGPVDELLVSHGVRCICTGQPDILAHPNRGAAAVQGAWNFRAARKMKEVLQQLDRASTIVHLHGWTKALSASVLSAVVSAGFRIVSTIHEYFMACPNGGFFNYKTQKVCHLRAMSGSCLLTDCDSRSYANKVWRLIRQDIAGSIAGIPGEIKNFIVISELSHAVMRPYLPKDAEIYRIGNPVEIAQQDPASPGSYRQFIYVGRLSPEKGPLLLAEAARLAKCSLTFVGDGEIRPQLQREYPEFSVTGWLPKHLVEAELSRSRALVLPSLWYENQPLVTLEAAARGIPSIVPDRCAARESVVDGETGLWFKGGDVADLAAKLRLLADAELVTRLGATAYTSFWSSPRTPQVHVSALEECYAKIMHQGLAMAG